MNSEKVYNECISRNLNTFSRAAMIENPTDDQIEVIRFISHEKQMKTLAMKKITN